MEGGRGLEGEKRGEEERREEERGRVVDSRSQKWKLRYYTRPNGKKRGPVFTASWRQFVKAKRLRVGDEFIFYGHQVRAADGQLKMKYMIEVKRRSMLTYNGEPVTLDVEYLA
ncbi:hypothetical protein LWI29_009632 [Acer saccharum]|uniref:TF-B3 domain-containing protein n=1 Tax=Acer saccharum TaxID=4024 RepID=A0AA39SX21_ACESA|nr:hypothetical protein LWI29_009632 [Acer saccharum]